MGIIRGCVNQDCTIKPVIVKRLQLMNIHINDYDDSVISKK